METQQIEQLLPSRHGFLYDMTHKVLPATFFTLFVASGTGVLILNMGLNQPIPSNYVAGFAIAFGVVIALIAIGNILLYARKQNNQVRSTSNSVQSSIGCEREVWYITWKHHLVKYEDRQRAFVREFVLKRKSKKNPRNRSVAKIEQIDSHINFNPSPEGTMTPVDNDLFVGRRRTFDDVKLLRELNPVVPCAIEKTRIIHEPELSEANGGRFTMSRKNRHRNDNLASIRATQDISTMAIRDFLPDTRTTEGQAACVEEMSFSAIQNRLTKPLLPEDVLKEHTLYSSTQKRPGTIAIQRNNIVGYETVPKISTNGHKSDVPTIPKTS